MTKIQDMKIEEIKPYENNPRRNEKAIDAVAKSIKEFGFRQPLIVDSEKVIICGHTRLKAAEKLGLKTVPVLIADDLTPSKVRAYRLADNKTCELSSWDEVKLLEEMEKIFNIEMADFGFDTSKIGKWHKSWARTEKYCDLKKKIKMVSCGKMYVASCYETGKRGITIAEIKENKNNVELFADNLCDFLICTYGESFLKAKDWAIVTAPRRRHKEGFHFSTAICNSVAEKLNVPFYENCFTAKNRTRINPEFILEKKPKEHNIIIYDDIVSTGETLETMRNLLVAEGYICYLVVGIRNKGGGKSG